jgi:signal transduction histidine kinase/DNA-binding response OmpR family regulator
MSINELERQNFQLQNSLAKMDLVLGAIDEAIVWTNATGDIEWCNDAFTRLINVQRISALGKDIFEILPLQIDITNKPLTRDKHLLTVVSDKNTYASGVFVYSGNERRIILEILAYYLHYNEHNPCVIFLIRDITQRRVIEQMKNEFISTVSHELRTPLTSIRGSLGLIMGGAMGDVPKEMAPLLDIANKNSERLIRLVNDILDTEKIEAGKMIFHFSKTNLAKLIEQAVIGNKSYADKYNIKYEFVSVVPDIQIKLDSDRIRQVLDNLLSNASKFSKSGGKVLVTMDRHDDNIRVSITDSGAGIPEEFQSQIFSKFYQADSSDMREKGGTGLGLSICKAIIESHNGKIGFNSTPNVGTTFYFELPEESATEDSGFIETNYISDKCILICEDDPDISNLLGLILRKRGYGSLRVDTIAAAKKALETQQFVLLTLDLLLPDGNGLELLQWIRSQSNLENIPVVVISGVSIEHEKLRGAALGIVDWISKPIDEERLYKDVAQALGGGNQPHKPKILHIEDDSDVAKVVARVIDDVADTEICETVAKSKKMLLNIKYDLIILDLNLKDGSGYEILAFLEENGYNIPVVILSVDEFDSKISKNIAASMVKSRVSNQDLLDKIVSILEQIANK